MGSLNEIISVEKTCDCKDGLDLETINYELVGNRVDCFGFAKFNYSF